MKSSSPITHEEVTKRAHEIWEQSGRPDGQETEHWLRAERELRQERERAAGIKSIVAESAAVVAGAKSGSGQKGKRVTGLTRTSNN